MMPDLTRLRYVALAAGVLGLAVTALTWLLDPRAFFAGYLAAYVFWSGIALGCLGIALLQQVTGGVWGLAVRRIAEAGARTLPLVALLFIPLLFGLALLYPWMHAEEVASSAALQQKSAYLNLPFFIGRTVFYMASWLMLAWQLDRWSTREDREANPAVTASLWRLGVGGLIVLGLTAAFAMIDWVMSLEPEWYSTVYPSMVATGSLLAAFAVVILTLLFLAPRSDLALLVTPQLRNDLGSLLLAFLMLWAYQQFSQYLLIWSGNLQEEVTWYLRRQEGVWLWASLALIVFGFCIPFFLLIFREIKRSVPWLAGIAGLLLAMRVVEDIWLVGPGLDLGVRVVGVALAAIIGIGGVWLWWYGRELTARPLIALHDPRLVNTAAVSAEAEHA